MLQVSITLPFLTTADTSSGFGGRGFVVADTISELELIRLSLSTAVILKKNVILSLRFSYIKAFPSESPIFLKRPFIFFEHKIL